MVYIYTHTPAPVVLCQPKGKGRFFQAIFFRKKIGTKGLIEYLLQFLIEIAL
jgi:hypothetical protein